MFKNVFSVKQKRKKSQLRGLLKRCCRKANWDGFICGWRVGGCDTVFKVRTGNALRFVGFGFGLMSDKSFWELLCSKELEVSVDSQGLCVPLKMWGWDGTGSTVRAMPPSASEDQLLTPRLLPDQMATEDMGHISAADGQG